jgi:hypothetical protein
VLALHSAVESTRRGATLTPDGVIPEEAFDDALARERYASEVGEIEAAVRLTLEPQRRLGLCIRRVARLRDALAAFAISVPVALWPPSTGTHTADWLQALLASLVALCGLSVAIAFGFYASAVLSFEKCVTASKGSA